MNSKDASLSASSSEKNPEGLQKIQHEQKTLGLALHWSVRLLNGEWNEKEFAQAQSEWEVLRQERLAIGKDSQHPLRWKDKIQRVEKIKQRQQDSSIDLKLSSPSHHEEKESSDPKALVSLWSLALKKNQQEAFHACWNWLAQEIQSVCWAEKNAFKQEEQQGDTDVTPPWNEEQHEWYGRAMDHGWWDWIESTVYKEEYDRAEKKPGEGWKAWGKHVEKDLRRQLEHRIQDASLSIHDQAIIGYWAWLDRGLQESPDAINPKKDVKEERKERKDRQEISGGVSNEDPHHGEDFLFSDEEWTAWCQGPAAWRSYIRDTKGHYEWTWTGAHRYREEMDTKWSLFKEEWLRVKAWREGVKEKGEGFTMRLDILSQWNEQDQRFQKRRTMESWVSELAGVYSASVWDHVWALRVEEEMKTGVSLEDAEWAVYEEVKAHAEAIKHWGFSTLRSWISRSKVKGIWSEQYDQAHQHGEAVLKAWKGWERIDVSMEGFSIVSLGKSEASLTENTPILQESAPIKSGSHESSSGVLETGWGVLLQRLDRIGKRRMKKKGEGKEEKNVKASKDSSVAKDWREIWWKTPSKGLVGLGPPRWSVVMDWERKQEKEKKDPMRIHEGLHEKSSGNLLWDEVAKEKAQELIFKELKKPKKWIGPKEEEAILFRGLEQWTWSGIRNDLKNITDVKWNYDHEGTEWAIHGPDKTVAEHGLYWGAWPKATKEWLVLGYQQGWINFNRPLEEEPPQGKGSGELYQSWSLMGWLLRCGMVEEALELLAVQEQKIGRELAWTEWGLESVGEFWGAWGSLKARMWGDHGGSKEETLARLKKGLGAKRWETIMDEQSAVSWALGWSAADAAVRRSVKIEWERALERGLQQGRQDHDDQLSQNIEKGLLWLEKEASVIIGPEYDSHRSMHYFRQAQSEPGVNKGLISQALHKNREAVDWKKIHQEWSVQKEYLAMKKVLSDSRKERGLEELESINPGSESVRNDHRREGQKNKIRRI